MASFGQRMGHGLGWLARNSRRFHIAAWLTVAVMVPASCARMFDERSRDWTLRYLPENFVLLAVLAMLALGIVGSFVLLVTEKRWRALVPILFGALVLALTFPPRSPFGDGALARVCDEERGCFFLTNEFVPTDTVYALWEAPGPGSPIWYRLVPGRALNYSEDGSHTKDPGLVLSGNGKILAVRRGGYFLDAVDLDNRRVLTSFISHTQPEADVAAQSARVAAILERNR